MIWQPALILTGVLLCVLYARRARRLRIEQFRQSVLTILMAQGPMSSGDLFVQVGMYISLLSGNFYPWLRAMEDEGLVISWWDDSGARRKRMYNLKGGSYGAPTFRQV